MWTQQDRGVRRRGLLSAAAALLSGLVLPATVRAGVPRTPEWRDNFDTLDQGAILVDSDMRQLWLWSGTEDPTGFACSVPASPDLSRRGMTRVIRKVDAPVWRPSPGMRALRPDLPARIAAGAPTNPMGKHALVLDWPYFRIHGTPDPATLGRAVAEGCFGLDAGAMAQVFAAARVGTPVRII